MSNPATVPQAWFRKTVPLISVTSVKDTVRWYKEKLGFVTESDESDVLMSIWRGTHADVNIYVRRAEDADRIPQSDLMIMLEPEAGDLEPGHAVRTFYESIKALGDVRITKELHVAPWKFYQFTIRDPDGHRLTFFQHGPDEPSTSDSADSAAVSAV